MRRVLLVLLLLLPHLSFATGNESVNTIPANDANFLTGSQTHMRAEPPALMSRFAGGVAFVRSGGLPATSGSCTATAIGLEAFTSSGNRITSDGAAGTTAINFAASNIGANCANPGSDVCWLVGSASGQDFTASGTRTTVSLPTLAGSAFNRIGSSNLYANCTSTTKPALPADSVYLAKVTITNAAITAVDDLRHPASYARQKVYDVTDPLYGGVADGTFSGTGTSNTAALNLALAAANYAGGEVFFPAGVYHFATQPGALKNGAVIRGEGQNVTWLVRGYSEGTATQGFLDMDVANTSHVANLGGGVRDLTLWAASGTTGGTGINMASDATTAQGQLLIDWVRITGDGTWAYNIRIDGSLKTSSASGIRYVVVRHAFLAQATTVGLLAIGFNHLFLEGLGIYTGAGTADLIVDGGTGGGVTSTNAIIACEFCTLVEIGKTQPTQGVHFSTTHTTTLTVSTQLLMFTLSGSVHTITGSIDTQSPNNYSFLGGGKIGAGIPAFTAGGAQLESADGLTFPAVQIPSANANTLDDYAENVWTPVIEGTSTAGTGTYSVQVGQYTKIGNIVHVSMQLVWSAHTGTGNMQVGGLPFSAVTITGFVSPCAVWQSNLNHGAGTQLMAYIVSNSTKITLRASDPGGTATAAIALDTAASLAIQCSYRATN
jgi:hypothetical protein